MGVDRGVAGGASKVLILTVGDVLVRSGITVFLGQAKVDDVDQVALLAEPHQEVVRLHVSVDEVLGVDVLNAADHLVSQQQDGLEAKLSRAEVEQIFQTGPQQLHHHHIVVTLGPTPLYRRNTHSALHHLVDFALYVELWVFGLHTFQLDGYLLSSRNVGTQIDVSK